MIEDRPGALPSSMFHSRFSCLICQRTSLLRDVRVELIAEFFDKCRRGHCRRVPEGADRISHNVAADVENQIQIRRFPLTVFDAVKNFFHPVTTLATRTALAARLMSVKTSDVPGCAHHAGGLVHDDHAARAE